MTIEEVDSNEKTRFSALDEQLKSCLKKSPTGVIKLILKDETIVFGVYSSSIFFDDFAEIGKGITLQNGTDYFYKDILKIE
jgi:hypothetical protein